MNINTKYDYEIINEINSEGVNSNLYMVNDLQYNQKLILKRIEKKKIKDIDKYFDESRKINSLNHPNIISITSTSYDEEYVYISMPYYEQGSLQQLIENRNLSLREIIRYSLGFISAIYCIHCNDMVHCDIKPSNILIDKNDNAIITDFGSALYLNKFGNAKLKNVYYKHIAPEQCTSSTISKKLDIYQIGTTLYRLCNGNEEYNKQAKRYKDLNNLKIACSKGKFPVRKKYMPHISKEMINIIEKCINVNSYERYSDVLEIMNDISSLEYNLDWYCVKEKEYKYIWVLNTRKIYVRIILQKEENNWKVIDDEKEILTVESKAKGYRVVRNIIKEYEKELKT